MIGLASERACYKTRAEAGIVGYLVEAIEVHKSKSHIRPHQYVLSDLDAARTYTQVDLMNRLDMILEGFDV